MTDEVIEEDAVVDTRPPVAIKPTIGRMVYFAMADAAAAALGVTKRGDQPFSAQIVHVMDDYTVSLVVHDHVGNSFAALDVALMPDADVVPDGSYAYWMAYQLGQAKAVTV